ncbi:MAG: ATP-binding protein [Chloroflexi bacterium]|nr:ATP-binding protein [Chloroflexota bacterium]
MLERTAELSTLFSASQTIAGSIGVRSHLPDILTTVIEATPPANAAAIFLYAPEADRLNLAGSVGFEESELALVRLRPSEGAPGLVFRTQTSIAFFDSGELAADITTMDERNRSHFENALANIGTIDTVILVPLVSRARCLGVLIVANVGNSLDSRLLTAQILADSIAVAIANTSLYEDLEARVEELKQTQAMLVHSEKMSSIGQLAAGVAHEINNPMGFISSNLNTLSEYARDLKQYVGKSDEVHQILAGVCNGSAAPVFEELDSLRKTLDIEYVLGDLENLVRESLAGSQRVNKIVHDLKTFSRADDGESQLADINAIMDSALNIVWNQLKYTCTVSKDYGCLPELRCNPNQIGQVFVNILVNASQAIGKDRPGEICIRTRANEKSAFVDIGDNGPGMSEAISNRIFDPFFTTKPVGQGTGLGLSISYNLIEKHRGNIYVKSEVGVGTTFTVELPLVHKA